VSVDFFGGDSTKNTVDLLVQVGVLIGFGAGAIGFIYKVLTGRLGKAIDERLVPIKQSQDNLAAKLQDIQDDLDRNSKNKEELDRERFRNVADSQNYIKDSIKASIDDTVDLKKKLEEHLHSSAGFIAQTNEKIYQIERTLIDFKSFISRVESR
jgi:gas vesicle protein